MHLDPLTIVTIGLAAAGAIAYVVDLRARVASLEQWRIEMLAELRGIRAGIDQLAALIRGDEA